MNSSENPQFTLPQEFEQLQAPQAVPHNGRTLWDLLYAFRWYLLPIIAIIGIVIGAVLFPSDLVPLFVFIASTYYPVIFCVIIGYFLMRHVLLHLYRPSGRLVFVTNMDTQEAALFLIPEQRFRTMNQPGNPLAYKTPAGSLIYFARYLNEQEIGYGWAHQDKWELLCADREAFKQVLKEYEYLLNRVMYLEGHLKIESARDAYRPMKFHLDLMGARLGLNDRVSFTPEPVKEKTKEQEDFNPEEYL